MQLKSALALTNKSQLKQPPSPKYKETDSDVSRNLSEESDEQKAETEIIVTNLIDLSSMFSGGAAKKKTYTMEYVPLHVGIKIRPDDEFYKGNAQKTYKEASTKLNNLAMAKELHDNEDQSKKLVSQHKSVQA